MPIQLDEYAVEGSTFEPVATFTDEAGSAVTPDSITWSLFDATGAAVNSLEDVAVDTPASEVTIVLSGDDLQLLDSTSFYEERYFVITAIVDTDEGDDLPVIESAVFKVINPKKVA